ncbi:DUF5707 domain-containing protein [Streptomyces sp. ITFR-6]|uniref:DUF5707 domain-containing protein n=1 Tax=Streptomyces sp. ITFR-6 TaxID=3075197 RepID=UPI00288C5258|nr:DUF5707 domain-containing protein [Streptomyces sp. ITFR-6]WNI29680.1 DUF5707 domain-containing protein [Streptomyces sp. ITFR-6]
MSKRVLFSSLIGAVAIGAVAAGGSAGSFSYTVDVSDDSGVRGLKVLVRTASSKLDPIEAELRSVESATCRSTSDETARCAYTVKVTKREAAGLAKGTWYVSALATAEDGDTTFVPHAATFAVTR